MPTLYQGYVFMAMLYYGMINGVILQIRNIIVMLIKNKIVIFLVDFIFALIGGIFFWYAIYKSNLGIFRLFLLSVYIIGTILINFCIGCPIENLTKKIYNKIYEKIKNKNKKEIN